jgi:hypothetical protein
MTTSGADVTPELRALLALGRNVICFEVRGHNGGKLNDAESRLTDQLSASDVADESSGDLALRLRRALGLTAESDLPTALALYWDAGRSARVGDVAAVRRFVRRIVETLRLDPTLMRAVTGVDLSALNS